MNLTEQQEAIVHSSSDLKINAVAGAGKTSTLIAYAANHPRKKILYLVFNKSVKEEAIEKFARKGLSNVTVETAHSMAYKALFHRGSSVSLNFSGYSAYEVRSLLKMSMGDLIHEMKIATQVVNLCSCFCNGSALLLKECDYLSYLPEGKERSFVEEYYDLIHKFTRTFLGMMYHGKIPITHEFYLKQYHLQHPTLPYDIVLFDEGQDASGVMLDIFQKQKARKVIVGDHNQQIYSWRYAINALETLDFEERFLSASFRFPQDVAGLANKVLERKAALGHKPTPAITGLGQEKRESPVKATIGRTNAGVLVAAIDELVEQSKIETLYFEGNFQSYTYADENGSIWDILNLQQGKKSQVRSGLIKGMKDMSQLKEYADEANDTPLKGLIDVVERYQSDLPRLVKNIKEAQVPVEQKHAADRVFSTVHKAKGMEYDEVTLVQDYMTDERLQELLSSGEHGVDKVKLAEEVNLLYVALTRTKNKLHIPDELLPIDSDNLVARSQHIYSVKTEEQRWTHSTTTEVINDDRKKAHKNAYKKWTEAEEKKITQLYEKGMSIKEIANKVKRNYGAVRIRLGRLGLLDHM